MQRQTKMSRFGQPSAAMRGFTIVEFMVSIALSMFIVIATTYVYLGSRETQRTLFEKSQAFESARYTLDVIGRDIENAAFYPAIRATTSSSEASSVIVDTYANPLNAGAPAAYDAGVFGCQNGRFDPSPSVQACAAQSTGIDADTLVVNYFTNDASGLDVGSRADCLRQDSANNLAINGTANLPSGATATMRRNVSHVATSGGAGYSNNPALLPQRPLFASNAYSLNTTVMQVEGQTINTFSLACNGSGVSTANAAYQPMISGIDELRFYYLVGPNTASQFKRANAVAASEWATVTAVRVCLLARSLQAARLQGSTAYTIADCDGTSKTFTDGIERRIFSQVFALKNKLQETF
jgi:type IV pilus assembly protein PilW